MSINVEPDTGSTAVPVATHAISNTHYPVYKDFLLDVAQGRVPGYSYVHKFGSHTVGTTITPVCQGGFYRTPQVNATVELAVISDNANDTAAGTGARELTVQYLDSSCALQTGTLATNGTSESAQTITDVLRVVRMYVSGSGVYATQSLSSQAGNLTLQVSGGGDVWGVIPLIGTFGPSQSLIGAYTIPAGYTAYILSFNLTNDSTKSANFYFFKRENIDKTSAPYDAMRLQNLYDGVTGLNELIHLTYESYPEKTDIGFLASVATGTADVSAEFEILLVQNG